MMLLTGIIIIACVLLACIVIYRYSRPYFPVKVNCWFCNSDTHVPYGNRNCWDCPKCEQYNGFSQDGDYNKPIPAQHNEDINHPISCRTGVFLTRSPFLCHTCQRNQLLAVKQLATFEPLNKTFYDEEMAFYKRHLESVYALCLSCDALVKRELKRIDERLEQNRSGSDKSESPRPAISSVTESEVTVSAHEVLGANIQEAVRVVSSLGTVWCALLLCLCCLRDGASSLLPHWLPASLLPDDTLLVALSGLGVCVLSKFVIGKGRLYIGDIVDIFLWLIALLASVYHESARVQSQMAWISLCLAPTLFCLETGLALVNRSPNNATTPIIRRLSLDKSPFSSNSDAASEAVSSVSTSCRRRQDIGDMDGQSFPSHHEKEETRNKKAVDSSLSGLFVPTSSTPERTENRNDKLSFGLGDLDGVEKHLGEFLIGPRTSESGYGSGRSSPFSVNSLGPVSAESSFGHGTAFTRPLLSAPKLSVVSFSQSSGTSSFDKPLQNQPPSLFSQSHDLYSSSRGEHSNPFLTQEPRPRSLFSSSSKSFQIDSYPAYFTQARPSLLFSPLTDKATPACGKVKSEADFPQHRYHPRGSIPSCTWWRDSMSDILDRDKTPERCIVQRKERVKLKEEKASEDQRECVEPPICDSTTPSLPHSCHDMPVKRKKKKSRKSRKHRLGAGGIDNFCMSDDDLDEHECDKEEAIWQGNRHSRMHKFKIGLTWMEMAAMMVVIISVATNCLLAWAVWTSK